MEKGDYGVGVVQGKDEGSGASGVAEIERVLLGRICSEEFDKEVALPFGGGKSERIVQESGAHVASNALKNPNKRSYSVMDGMKGAQQQQQNHQNGGGFSCPFEASCGVADECRSNAGRCGLHPTRLAETYYGYIETVEDAVLIVEACRYGRLMRVKRRLHEKERQGIRSGSVFVFVERESGIRRWTDGKLWSPSRICGEFLLYRELESRQQSSCGNGNGKRIPTSNEELNGAESPSSNHVNWGEQVAKILSERKAAAGANAIGDTSSTPVSASSSMSTSPIEEKSGIIEDAAGMPENPTAQSQKHPQAINGAGTLLPAKSNQMSFKKDGLIKKTISLTVAEETYHLICYFKDSNLGTELLPLTPCRSANFKNLEVCRNPVSYPIMMIQQQQSVGGGGGNPNFYHHHPLLRQQQQATFASGYHHPHHQQLMNPQQQLFYNHLQQQQQYFQMAAHHQHPYYSQYQQAPSYLSLPGQFHPPKMSQATIVPQPKTSSCSSGSCNGCDIEGGDGGCPAGSRKNFPSAAIPKDEPTRHSTTEEEKMLFCHFLEAVQQTNKPTS